MPTKPIPVRLRPEVIARLDAVADVADLDRSDVIKLCLNRFLDELDANPGELLNRDWKSVLKLLDGRTFRYPPPASHLRVADDPDTAAPHSPPAPPKAVTYKIPRKKKKP